jgi:hypothetical protein
MLNVEEEAYELHVDIRNVFSQSSRMIHRRTGGNCIEENTERVLIE